MIKTSSSAPNSDLFQWILPKLKLWEPIEPVEKKFEILIKCSLKNKESNKKTMRHSEFGWVRYDQNKPKCFEFEPAPMNSNWTEIFGGPNFLPYSMMWTTREIGHDGTPKWTTHPHHIGPQMNLHKAQKPIKAKRGPWRGHMKTWVHVTPIG